MAILILVVLHARLITSKYQGVSGPDIVSTLSKDTMVYFGMIATSHLVIVIMFAAARVRFLVLLFELHAF